MGFFDATSTIILVGMTFAALTAAIATTVIEGKEGVSRFTLLIWVLVIALAWLTYSFLEIRV